MKQEVKKDVHLLHQDIYNFLEHKSNQSDISGYEWREVCGIMKQMEDLELVEVNFSEEPFEEGDTVVAKYGWNDVLDKPFESLYEFGYLTAYGCVVYKQGERNMQDSCAFKLRQIRKATDKDYNEILWG